MKIEAHVLARDEAEILPYTFRHYTSFCEKVFLHDMGSTDDSLELVDKFGVTVCSWDTADKVDDRVNRRIKNECWMGTDADWVIVADADELIYFPQGHQKTLDAYERAGVTVAKPYGFEMFSDQMPTTTGQIYDEIKKGAADDKWYSKPVLFSPKRVEIIDFAVGAHKCETIVLKDGRQIPSPINFTFPPFYLLHYHQIGSIEKIAAKYDRTRARMCDNNIQQNWGNVHDSGRRHAQDKRAYILSRLQQVVP
jgi:hypothetical protein